MVSCGTSPTESSTFGSPPLFVFIREFKYFGRNPEGHRKEVDPVTRRRKRPTGRDVDPVARRGKRPLENREMQCLLLSAASWPSPA